MEKQQKKLSLTLINDNYNVRLLDDIDKVSQAGRSMARLK